MNSISNNFTCSLLLTGSELMMGDTIDSNSSMIAQSLLNLGIEIAEKSTVGDALEDLVEQITRLSQKSHLLIINGGLGPTQDDLTVSAIAKAADVDVIKDPTAEKHVIDWCQARNFTANGANLKQAYLPDGAKIFPKAPGSAPAFYNTVNDCLVIATPGVPSELKHILKHQLIDYIGQSFEFTPKPAWKKYQLLGIGESRLQQKITTDLPGIDDVLELGFRAGFPTLELKFRPQSQNTDTSDFESKLLALIEDHIIAQDNQSPAEYLVELLKNRGLSVSCAESCTGGLIASQITQAPGASVVFPGGVVSYSNAIKSKVLNVKRQVLTQYGAVSQEVVHSMLSGILDLMETDIGVSVSGIAGPDGGTEAKPVGTVWIAWGDRTRQNSIGLCIPLGRIQFQQIVAAIALDLLRRTALGQLDTPKYLSRWEI